MKIIGAYFTLLLFIYLFDITHGPVIYNCAYVSYPIAVDVPKEVIKECRVRKLT